MYVRSTDSVKGIGRANRAGGLALAGKVRAPSCPSGAWSRYLSRTRALLSRASPPTFLYPLSSIHFASHSGTRRGLALVMVIAAVGNLLFLRVMGGRLGTLERLRAGWQNGY